MNEQQKKPLEKLEVDKRNPIGATALMFSAYSSPLASPNLSRPDFSVSPVAPNLSRIV